MTSRQPLTQSSGPGKGPPSLTFTCTPAQHNSGRSALSQNKTLWASWFVNVESPSSAPVKIFFGGDTGYRSKSNGPVCPEFERIATELGSPDVAFLPLAAGSVLPFLEKLLHIRLDHEKLTSSIHCTPRDAVEIHRSMRAKRSVGIHWGTFTTALHAAQTVAEVAKSNASHLLEEKSESHGTELGVEVVDVGSVQRLV